ncbi:ribose-phosphate pyrophosphokinase [Pseudomonas sp. H3(2019)]|uniref:ribose-phosphate diphosphokinase n=1 Tax=Pseudomonas sp. H3(2019) TaxID=2598724 RepID=UPI001194D266|nr:ribose-phosphate diphosphokinase [Pseudomonas sp. H3(2019)]TVT81450.1 ribose-phosphate pyrophosphokinase [Pseudomonas sp. H3(2019)]
MLTERPLLFALQGSEHYASRVAQRLGCQLAHHEERDYEDGEHKCRPLESVNGREVVVFHSLYGDDRQSAHDKLCRLLFFCGALKDAGARQVQAVTPYLCYGRKDRRTQPQDPTITRYVAAMIEACGVDRLVALEVHNPAAFDNAFRIPTWNVQCTELFARHFAGIVGDAEVVSVSPDAGGTKRAEQFRQALEQQLGRAVGGALMEKHRAQATFTGTLLVGEVQGKTAIIYDDLISTGETLMHAGLACQQAGAARLFAAATHGLFTGGTDLLDKPLFEHLVIADSVPPFRLPADCVTRRLHVLDSTALVAALLAESASLSIV